MRQIARPKLAAPPRDVHKYSRGLVAVVQGEMPGAAMLAAQAAMHGGASYVILAGRKPTPGPPHALVRRRIDDLLQLLDDERIGALLIGPGLGDERAWVEQALASALPLVLDGDALRPSLNLSRTAPTVITPHGGEFDRLFGASAASKADRTREAAAETGCTIVHKGAETIVSSPRDAAIEDEATSWLSTAGTGDVLAGLVAARLAATGDPQAAAEQAVWLHARAAALAGPAFIADDLIPLIPQAIAECL